MKKGKLLVLLGFVALVFIVIGVVLAVPFSSFVGNDTNPETGKPYYLVQCAVNIDLADLLVLPYYDPGFVAIDEVQCDRVNTCRQTFSIFDFAFRDGELQMTSLESGQTRILDSEETSQFKGLTFANKEYTMSGCTSEDQITIRFIPEEGEVQSKTVTVQSGGFE